MKAKHVQLKINPQEHVIVQLEEPMLFDKLHTLSADVFGVHGSAGQFGYKTIDR